jgi:hypothetical protein
MNKLKVLYLLAVIPMLATVSVSAHHNPGYYFDMRVSIVHKNATVVSYEAANPHGRLVYTLTDDNGVVSEWLAELPANNMMRRYGATGDMMSAGDRITLKGNAGRNGATMLRVTHVLLPSGNVGTFYARQGSGTLADLEVD